MYQFQPRRFDGDDGWFNIGTISFGTTGVIALLAIVGMFLVAIEGNGAVSQYLIFNADDVIHGQVWRLVTWFIPNDVSIWTVLGAVVLFLLGRTLDMALGKQRSVQFALALILIPSVLATVSWLILPVSAYTSAGLRGYPLVFASLASYLSTSIFLSFVLRLPKALFFFGIPGWVLAAVFIGLDYLGMLADRQWGAMLFLTFVLVMVWAACNAFGLTNAGPDMAFGGGGMPMSRPAPRPSGGGGSPLDKLKGVFKRNKGGEVSNLDDYRMPGGRDNYDALGIDAILDQIAERGIDSLSSEQRKILDLYRRDR